MKLSAKKIQHSIGTGLGIAMAFVAINFFFDPRANTHEPLFAFDAWFYDRLLVERPAPERETNGGIPEVFIIEFDEDSFTTLELLDDPRLARWPWSPALFAQAIDRLNALGVAVIGVDTLFTEPHLLNKEETPDGLETRLAKACRDHGRVVLANTIETVSHGGSVSQNRKDVRAVLRDAAYTGAVGLPKDPDDTVRNAHTFFEHDGITGESVLYPTFATEIVRLFRDSNNPRSESSQVEKTDPGNGPIPLHHETFYIVFGEERVERFPFYLFVDGLHEMFSGAYFGGDLVADMVEPFDLGRFKNSIVLLGATSRTLHDEFMSPLQNTPIPGVEIQANIVKTLLAGEFLTHADDRLQMYGTLLLSMAVAALCAFASIRTGILSSVSCMIGWTVGSGLALLFGDLVIRTVTPAVCISLAVTATLSYRYIFEEREKLKLKRLFSKATDAALVEQLLENPERIRLGGDCRRVTIFFSDIRSFSTFSEAMEPERLIGFLNEYFSAATEVIFRNNGMIDKFSGDAVMAIFGAPLPVEDHAYWACKTAVEMLEAQRRVSQSWQTQGQAPFRIGIGIHTGHAVFGNLGAEQRSDYTCIGDSVNVASRIEGLNKTFTTELLISESTYKECSEYLEVRKVGKSEIRGRKGKVHLYELLKVRPRETQKGSENASE